MPRNSSTWRSSALCLLGALLAGCPGRPGGEDVRLCLPPVFEGGQRMHQLEAVEAFWLELLLRQHEVCWRRPDHDDEKRIFVLGSSSVYGFPIPVEETFVPAINRDFEARGSSAHVYNLAMNFPYQLRDMVVLEKALAYQPDLILYPLTLAEFDHHAPTPWRAQVHFFDSNYDTGLALLGLRPPGLLDPLERYEKKFRLRARRWAPWERLREIGSFTRVMAGQHALLYASQLSGHPPPAPEHSEEQGYQCAEVKLLEGRRFWRWQEWNPVEYLEWIRERTGVEVAMVHWPLSHDPREDCYNARFSNRLVDEFEGWLEEETGSRGIPLLNLRGALPNEAFFDTVHLNEKGHRRLAPLVQRFAVSVIEERRQAAERE